MVRDFKVGGLESFRVGELKLRVVDLEFKCVRTIIHT